MVIKSNMADTSDVSKRASSLSVDVDAIHMLESSINMLNYSLYESSSSSREITDSDADVDADVDASAEERCLQISTDVDSHTHYPLTVYRVVQRTFETLAKIREESRHLSPATRDLVESLWRFCEKVSSEMMYTSTLSQIHTKSFFLILTEDYIFASHLKNVLHSVTWCDVLHLTSSSAFTPASEFGTATGTGTGAPKCNAVFMDVTQTQHFNMYQEHIQRFYKDTDEVFVCGVHKSEYASSSSYVSHLPVTESMSMDRSTLPSRLHPKCIVQHPPKLIEYIVCVQLIEEYNRTDVLSPVRLMARHHGSGSPM